MHSIWDYADALMHPVDLREYDVEASDGTIGQVERQGEEGGMHHLIVDTGVWIFGRSILVPAGLIDTVDHDRKMLTVRYAKDDIKSAPQFGTDSEATDPAYLLAVEGYYRMLLSRAVD
ncbi:PRC-barrel domain containing protein [Streptomyces sp. NPDC002004]